jgi:endonuclease/exonuclease/phosphatase family metal-dependent hydrolase
MSRQTASLANWQALSDQLPESCLRIASYNVHGCVGSDGRKDALRISEVIRELECDTVGLQEVDYRLDYIAGRLEMQAVPGLTLLRHDGPFGNALLTRRKILDVRRLALGYGRREPRNALDVDLEVCGQKLRVIVTHLGLFAGERRWQVRKLLDRLRHTPAHERVIVLGDINEWLPLSRPLRWMNGIFGRSVVERSFPSRWPLLALDRVWVRPRPALLALKAHRSPLAARASDHLPVKAIVATQNLRWDPHALSEDTDAPVGKFPIYAARRGS